MNVQNIIIFFSNKSALKNVASHGNAKYFLVSQIQGFACPPVSLEPCSLGSYFAYEDIRRFSISFSKGGVPYMFQKDITK